MRLDVAKNHFRATSCANSGVPAYGGLARENQVLLTMARYCRIGLSHRVFFTLAAYAALTRKPGCGEKGT
jgi:hypothetical protein